MVTVDTGMISCDTVSQNLGESYCYCGICSGILIKNAQGKVTCLHCQMTYETPPSVIVPTHRSPILPSQVINYLRKNNHVTFDQTLLMKTLKKENYRRLYDHWNSTGKHSYDSELTDLVNQLKQILSSGQFTDHSLKRLHEKYGKTLVFYLDINHLTGTL